MFRQIFTYFPTIFLFKKSPIYDDYFDTENVKDAPVDFGKIRCPQCRWQPKASSRWFCADDAFHIGCGTTWNTFDTRGKCPGCSYQWVITDCLRCLKSSPHEDWYETSEEK
jgi:hypothetical protein